MKVLSFGVDGKIVDYAAQNGCTFIFGSKQDSDILKELIECEAPAAVTVDLDQHSWMLAEIEKIRRHKVSVPIAGICEAAPDVSISNRRATFLEAGGNDLMYRPVDGRELLASLRAMHHLHVGAHQQSVLEGRFKRARITLDTSNIKAFVNNKKLTLTLKEFQVLEILMENSGKAMKQDEIKSALYGYLDAPDGNTLQVFIVRLRAKISLLHHGAGEMIETVRGVGYRINC